MIRMTRRLVFSAAHADWLQSFSCEENEQLFGPQASPEPYGHNYELDVCVQGDIDPRTGILVNIKEIDHIVKEHIVRILDKKYINRQVPAFYHQPVTAENLTLFIVRELVPHLPQEVTLARVTLMPTATHSVEWKAPDDRSEKESGKMYLTRVYEFSASHRLHSPHLTAEENRELFGKCNYDNGHGHNYILEVTVAGPVDARSGRVLDESLLDAVVHAQVVDRYDHRHFNVDIPEFDGLVPSAEVITRIIWDRLQGHIPSPARLHRVVLKETARNIFEYCGEDDKRL